MVTAGHFTLLYFRLITFKIHLYLYIDTYRLLQQFSLISYQGLQSRVVPYLVNVWWSPLHLLQQSPSCLSIWWISCSSPRYMLQKRLATPTLSLPLLTDSPSVSVVSVTQSSLGSSSTWSLVVSVYLHTCPSPCIIVCVIHSSLLPFFPSSLPCTHMHTVLGHITKQSERYKIFILAEDSETDYLMNYNLTTLPYQYYRYIQSWVFCMNALC